MPRRQIALIFEYSTLNGGERSMLAALDWLRRNDSEFDFVAIGPPSGRLADALAEREIRLVPWSVTATSGYRHSLAEIDNSLIQNVAAIRPDLVHANSLAMGRILGRVATHIQVPTTAHLRDIIKLSATSVADLNRNRMLIAVSHAAREFHVGQGLDEHKTVVVQNGVDLNRFHPRPSTGWLLSELRQRHDLKCDFPTTQPFDAPVKREPIKLLACIGQVGLRKGQDILALAAPAIVERVPSAHFLLIGERTSQKTESIDFERNITDRFADAGLASRLLALGHREDVPELLSEIDLLIHPAKQEPFGRVLLEASATGVPIVATNVGGTAEIVEHGVTGMLVPAGDPRALAEAAITVLTNEPEAQRLRVAARQRAEQLFSIERAAQNLANAWENALS